jgi:hypothetical protein
MGILTRYTLLGINHYQGYISSLQGFYGAQYTVFFDALLDLAAPSDACGVDERYFLAVPEQLGIDSITSRTRDRADNGAFFTD